MSCVACGVTHVKSTRGPWHHLHVVLHQAEELRRINERPDHIKYDEREQALASISVHLHRQRSDPRPRWLQK